MRDHGFLRKLSSDNDNNAVLQMQAESREPPPDTKFRIEAVIWTIKKSSVICVQEFST